MCGNVVGATTVCSGNVNLVVLGIQRRIFKCFIVVDIERTKVFELTFPKHSAGVNVAGAKTIDALNKKSPADDLFGWAVTMSRKDIQITAATKPQHTKWQFDAAIVGLNRIGNIAVLMSPVGRTRQSANAFNHHAVVADADRCLL